MTPGLDTVVFDLGGVLIDWDPRHLYRQLFADEAEMESFLADVCSMEWHRRFDAGRPIAEGIAELVERHPDLEPMIRAYADRWQDMFAGEVSGSVAVLEELSARRVRLLAITNWPGETFPAARERFPFLDRFEGVVVSGDEGVTKPDPRLFELLADRYGVDPSASLFVDDAPANVEAAAAIGFATLRFTDAASLRARARTGGPAVRLTGSPAGYHARPGRPARRTAKAGISVGDAPASEPVLQTEDLGPVRRLTMNRPKALNALSGELIDAMSRALDDAAVDDTVRVLILRGAGRAFCSGYDLSEDAEAGTKDSVGWYTELQHSAEEMLKFFDHPKPIVAQVHKYCLAGGCDLMMCCDLTVCSDDAVFGEPEIRFGSGVVTMVMPWLLGARKAKELLFTGEDRIDAKEALRIGLVNRVVPFDQLDDATLHLAEEIAKNDPFAVSMQKKAINAAWEGAGFRQAIEANVALDTLIETADLPERTEFRAITLDKGLKEAIAWRDGRFRSQR